MCTAIGHICNFTYQLTCKLALQQGNSTIYFVIEIFIFVFLLTALEALPYGDGVFSYLPPVAAQKEPVVSVRDAVLAATEYIPLEACAGHICAQAAGAYPPGVATLFPGERIEQADVQRMCAFRDAGLSLFGITEGQTACIKTEKAV